MSELFCVSTLLPRFCCRCCWPVRVMIDAQDRSELVLRLQTGWKLLAGLITHICVSKSKSSRSMDKWKRLLDAELAQLWLIYERRARISLFNCVWRGKLVRFHTIIFSSHDHNDRARAFFAIDRNCFIYES